MHLSDEREGGIDGRRAGSNPGITWDKAMTIKKADNPFGLAPISPLAPISASEYRLTRRTGLITRRERATAAEWRIQMMTIEAQKAKTLYGEYVIGDIHEHATATFAETVSNILLVKETARTPEVHHYVSSYCERQISLAARHIEHASVFGAENVLAEIERSPRVELPKPTFWERIFGSNDDF